MITRPLFASALGCSGFLVISMTTTVFAGAAAMFSPLISAFWALTALGICLLIGLILRIPILRKNWEQNQAIAVTTLVVGIALFLVGFCFVKSLPPPPLDEDPDGWPIRQLGDSTLPGLMLTIFAVAHWPVFRSPLKGEWSRTFEYREQIAAA